MHEPKWSIILDQMFQTWGLFVWGCKGRIGDISFWPQKPGICCHRFGQDDMAYIPLPGYEITLEGVGLRIPSVKSLLMWPFCKPVLSLCDLHKDGIKICISQSQPKRTLDLFFLHHFYIPRDSKSHPYPMDSVSHLFISGQTNEPSDKWNFV